MAHSKADLATIANLARWVAVVLFVAVLYWAKDIFIPLALGLLLSFLLSPLVNRLQRWGMSNLFAVLLTATLTFALLGGGFTLIGRELTKLIGDLPNYKHELVAKARSVAGLTTGVGGEIDQLASEVAQAIENESEVPSPQEANMFQRWTDRLFPENAQPVSASENDGRTSKTPLYVQPVSKELPLATWATTAGTVLGPLATAGLVSVFALFMLVHREDLRDRIMTVISRNNYVTTTEALDEAAQRISRYLLAQTIINTSYGFVLATGLSLIGVLMTDEGIFPNAVLWGVTATLLRFVPYMGPIVAALFPLAIALSVFPGYGVVTAVLALIVVMELLSNNVFEPWLYGASSGISAVAVIVAAVFWGWLWGPVGLLLSTPLTVCLVVLGRYVPGFKSITMLLGEQVPIQTYVRLYQRLLAGEYDRAQELLSKYASEKDFNLTCDRVLIPLLRRVRADLAADYLSDTDANRLFSLIGGLIDGLIESHVKADSDSAKANASHQAERSQPVSQPQAIDDRLSASSADVVAQKTNTSKRPLVIGCMTHHLSESLVLNMLRGAGQSFYQLQSLDEESLPEEIAQQIVQDQPLAVVLVVLPKGGFAQARYQCKAIRDAGYRGTIVVCCLGRFKNFDKLFVSFRRVGATSLSTTLSQTHDKLKSLTSLRGEPVLMRPQVARPATGQAVTS